MSMTAVILRALLLSMVLFQSERLAAEPKSPPDWTEGDLRILRSLWIGSLKSVPPDPSNRVADDPKAAELGEQLFFDMRLSANGEVACATCHRSDLYFTDGRALARGIGETKRGAPTLIGVAYSPWLFWDGRRDSLWSQALAPLETAEEHGFDRRRVLNVIATDTALEARYERVFGPLPDKSADDKTVDRAFSNVGKALAAFERTLLPKPSRFDAYVASILNDVDGDPDDGPDDRRPHLSPDEIAGLRLFISDATQCLRCHNGPLFTNFGFHNIGLIEGKRGVQVYDFGRVKGVREAIEDPFRCDGPFSDAPPDVCIEERFVLKRAKELVAAFKVPTLRNVAATAPYMHDGRFSTLRDVVQHYKEAPSFRMGFQQLTPLDLTPHQLDQLVAFLGTLTGPPPTTSKP